MISRNATICLTIILALSVVAVAHLAAVAGDKSGNGAKGPTGGQTSPSVRSKYQGPSFDAKGNSAGMETITLQHEGARRTK
jgi:hypothetical protein